MAFPFHLDVPGEWTLQSWKVCGKLFHFWESQQSWPLRISVKRAEWGEDHGVLRFVCVCFTREIRMSRWLVGSQGSLWESLWVEGVSSDGVPGLTWQAGLGHAEASPLKSAMKTPQLLKRWWKILSVFQGERLSRVLEIWHHLQPWPPLPCCWVTSHCWPWNYVCGEPSLGCRPGVRNYCKNLSLYPTQS